jgi:ribosomal protein S18 acetylase RimI-like enzyme
MTVAGADLEAARRALELARRAGIKLVYWPIDPGLPVPDALLAEYAGRLVDRKATYRSDLSAADRCKALEVPERLRVGEYPRGPASAALRSLAVAAGEYSRFRTDPDIAEEKFVGLYTTWIERSARRELADVVLVAEELRDGELVGMVTVATEADTGDIGLIAIAGGERGRRLGRLLVRAAQEWMIGHGCRRSRVVTQLANTAAGRLYERCGYRLYEVKDYYHFWPHRGQ